MFHLRLKKGLSYCGAVKATRSNPDVFTKDKAAADAAVASGYFALVDGSENEPIVGHFDPKQLETMKVSDLKKIAEDMGLDTDGFKKEQLVAAISAVGVSAPTFDAEALAVLNLDGLVAYADEHGISLEGIPSTRENVLEAICVANGGSYTMLDLMRE